MTTPATILNNRLLEVDYGGKLNIFSVRLQLRPDTQRVCTLELHRESGALQPNLEDDKLIEYVEFGQWVKLPSAIKAARQMAFTWLRAQENF